MDRGVKRKRDSVSGIGDSRRSRRGAERKRRRVQNFLIDSSVCPITRPEYWWGIRQSRNYPVKRFGVFPMPPTRWRDEFKRIWFPVCVRRCWFYSLLCSFVFFFSICVQALHSASVIKARVNAKRKKRRLSVSGSDCGFSLVIFFPGVFHSPPAKWNGFLIKMEHFAFRQISEKKFCYRQFNSRKF